MNSILRSAAILIFAVHSTSAPTAKSQLQSPKQHAYTQATTKIASQGAPPVTFQTKAQSKTPILQFSQGVTASGAKQSAGEPAQAQPVVPGLLNGGDSGAVSRRGFNAFQPRAKTISFAPAKHPNAANSGPFTEGLPILAKTSTSTVAGSGLRRKLTHRDPEAGRYDHYEEFFDEVEYSEYESDSHDSDCTESDSHESDSHDSCPESDSHDSDSHDSCPESDSHDSDSHDSCPESDSHDSDSHDSCPESDSHDSDSHESCPESDSHESECTDSDSHESECTDSDSHDSDSEWCSYWEGYFT